MSALFDTVLKHVPAQLGQPQGAAAAAISSAGLSSFVGRIGVGRISQGTLKPGMDVLGDGRTGRQGHQGPHQPGADIPGLDRMQTPRQVRATSC